MTKKRLWLAAAGAAALVAAGYYTWAPREAPAGQPPLVALQPENFETIRAAFNSAAGQVRILLLLSPT